MALVLARLGMKVIVVERGRHPRFAIGESSTPLANLALEELGRRYNLPQLVALSEYGRWKKGLDEGVLRSPLACGLKRGFSYYQHRAGEPFVPRDDNANELLVAASPNDEVGDTHWFREHFDHFLIHEVQNAGIPYLDGTEIKSFARGSVGGAGAIRWQLAGARAGSPVLVTAGFLVDATGPGSALARLEGIDTRPSRLRTNCWSVYSHFTDVALWEDIHAAQMSSHSSHSAGGICGAKSPFRCDDAALHHLLDDGWIWVLRFENGVTSAGVAYDGERRAVAPESISPEAIWGELLRRYPSIAVQFEAARPVQPFVKTGRLQRCAERVVGPDWAMLAHAAYFLDPFFSGGNAHSLLTIERLAEIIERHWQQPAFSDQMAHYERNLLAEVDFLDLLIHGCYETFGRFPLFAAYSMYYFAAAILSETRRRAGEAGPWDGFLSRDWGRLHASVRRTHDELRHWPEAAAVDLYRRVADDIADFNFAGLCDSAKKNHYPFVPAPPGDLPGAQPATKLT
jgi:FADH2 O2-dependent halogenase